MMDGSFPADELAACLERASRSPFYRQRFDADAHRDWDRFRRVPLTRKADLRMHGSSAFLTTHEKLYQYHETFGTSGRPCGSWFTARDYANDLDRVRYWTKPFAEHRVLIRFPYSLSMPAHLAQRGVETQGGSIIAGSSRTSVCSYARAARLVEGLEIEVIAGPPFDLLLLTEASRRLGLCFGSVRAVSVAGELLSDGYLRAVAAACGASIHNLYGSTETAAIATSCERGFLHACEGQLIEILDPSGGQAQPPGAIGRVVVTTLDREAMPMVRYEMGDYASWLPARSCGCGREGILIEPHGRFFLESASGPRSEREALDLAWSVVDRWGAVFFEARLDRGKLRIRLEGTEQVAAADATVPLDVEIEWIPAGTLVDPEVLLTDEPAGKPRLVVLAGEEQPPRAAGPMDTARESKR